MAKGKNKRISKKGKGAKKGEKHPFLKKEWYTLIAPPALKNSKVVGWTCCKRPVGTQVVSDFLKNRVCEISYADVTGNSKDLSKRVKMIIDEIQGKTCFTSFYSYQLSREKVCAMLKKRQSLIDVFTDVKTSTGDVYRMFIVLVSNRAHGQRKLNSYVKHSTEKILRKKLIIELVKMASELTSRDLAYEVLTDNIQFNLEKVARKIVPNIKLQIVKVKTVKRGNVDIDKLVEDSKKQAKENADDDDKHKEAPEAVNTLT